MTTHSLGTTPHGLPIADSRFDGAAPAVRHAAGAAGSAPPAGQPWALGFGAAVSLSADELGGKGWGLVQMHANGMPVPAGFCLPSHAFERFLAFNGLPLAQAWADHDHAVLSTLARRIREGEFPPGAASEILLAYAALGSGPVAVRSSAIGEDSAAYSFAGQHDSFLYVNGSGSLLDRVRDCWASILNAGALAYRRSRLSGAAGAGGVPAMAVVVQAMVAAQCAGVAFARNPLNGRDDQVLVEACYGLGEGLVSGRASADLYVLDAVDLALVERQVRSKASAMRWHAGAGRVEEQAVPEDQREAAVLDTARARTIGDLLVRCNALFGGPQDIEWAQHDGVTWLLQSRPITGVVEARSPHQGRPGPEVAQRALWSRMDIGEIFTGRMTPLGLSFARHYQYKVHQACGTGIGLLDLGEPDEYMGYYKGHVYLNVAYTAHLLSQTPAGQDQGLFLRRFASGDVDLDGYRNPYGERHRGPRWRSWGYWIGKTLGELAGAKARAARMVASRFREFDRASAQDLGGMDLDRLREELTHALDYFRAMHIGYLPFYINAFGTYGLLEQLCQAWLPGDGQHLQNRLKGDMSNLRTIRSARDIWTLRQSLPRYPRVEGLLRAMPAGKVLVALREHPEGVAFLRDELAPFLRENGMRARQEMELSHPRWIDDPTYVFQILKIYLGRGNTVAERLASAGARREHGQEDGGGMADDDTEVLLRRLPLFKRAVMRRVIRLYCGCSELREETRMSMITSIWLVRRILVEVASRLRSEGVLADESELAYLDFQDLCAYLNGQASAAECFPRARIEAARGLHESRARGEEPPMTFIGEAPIARAGGAVPGQEADGALRGLGTSRGCVRAMARVIDDLEAQAGELQKGEIIVTRFTDASWTPLFAFAGGIVTDVGSMLSHSSIVAREFGLPCVVNTVHATARIRTGDWVSLDGETGEVHIESGAAPEGRKASR
ncbi:hypothetical protein BKK81_22680 [Cupriavidus sp. USMAHM13]|uniref:PEP/pyruvate-binding domain-containing protein n=1 Tax=Cupriavidus sp. USMAHM13 TaxID=1389192 RepID=UPI0008A67DD9|nr:PEP/pyruvate-binding domain-containing protein [Cupriavidus sp. USMAHM13]AOZ02122.1 hypothetical protein BKK81_22680 [Cupriavidus sp. USMAHM13]